MATCKDPSTFFFTLPTSANTWRLIQYFEQETIKDSNFSPALKPPHFAGMSLFKAYVRFHYGKKEVANFELDLSQGCRLSYGDVKLQQTIIDLMRGNAPGFSFQSQPMPSYTGSNKHVNEILERSDQGFTLRIDSNADLHVMRLCQSQIFYFDADSSRQAEQAVKMERYMPQELFSYKAYVRKLLEQVRDCVDVRPQTKIRLFIGSKPRSRSSEGLVSVTIEPSVAKDIYSKFSLIEPSHLAFSMNNSIDDLIRALY